MFKRFCAVFTTVLVLCFCMTLLGDEIVVNYFPSTLDSYWIYEDQDGNKLKQTVIEGEEIAGEIYHAFKYEPAIKDWSNFSRFIHPELFKVTAKGIILSTKEGIEKAVKARLTKEFDVIFKAAREQLSPDYNPTINITVAAEDNMQLMLTPIISNEEWDVIEIKAKILVDAEGSLDYTIKETGIVLGTEKTETAAGAFVDCLKVEYRTETTFVIHPLEDDLNPPGETVTTLWYAPDVGVVKIHQKQGHKFLDMIPKENGLPYVIPPAKETTWELKEFKIGTEKTDSNQKN